MFELANGAKILKIEIDNTDRIPRGVVLAETETDYVTWRVWQGPTGMWLCESGNHFPKKLDHPAARVRAGENYNYRRGMRSI